MVSSKDLADTSLTRENLEGAAPQPNIKLESDKRRKRKPRGIIVCKNCRKRKVRCDKQRPCSNCVKFHQTNTCTYDEPQADNVMKGFLELRLPMTKSNLSRGNKFQDDDLINKRRKRDDSAKQMFDANNTLSENKAYLKHLKDRIHNLESAFLNGKSKSLSQSLPSIKASHASQNSPGYSVSTLPSITLHSNNASNCGITPTQQQSYASGSITNSFPIPSIVQSSSEQNRPQPSSLPPFNHQATNNHARRIHSSLFERNSLPEIRHPDLDIRHDYRPIFERDRTAHGEGLSVSHPFLGSPSRKSPLDNCQSSHAPYFIGVNPHAHITDTINFYHGYSSVHYKDHLRRLNFGPFAWSSLMKRDYGLRLMWDYVVSKKEKFSTKGQFLSRSVALMFAQTSDEMNDESTATILSKGREDEHLEKQFERRALQTDGVDDMIPYEKVIRARQKTSMQKVLLNKHTLSLGLTVFDGQIDRELQIIEKIEVVLPKKRVLWKLITRFFHSVYTYMPFIDEDYFRKDVESIIGPESYDDVPIDKIRIAKKLDFATVGILLIIVRLAYLSLFSNNSALNEAILNNPNPNDEDKVIQYLMNNPININIIDVASLCLDQFQILRRSNFTVLQLALFLRLYHTYAPEDGDRADGGDSQVLTSVLIQTAYSLGMNREPDENFTDSKMRHITRKIWWYLVASDLHLSYSFGNPPSTDERYFDIMDPVCEPGSENIRDISKDRATTIRLKSCLPSPKLRKILSYALDIRQGTNLPTLCEDLSDFEVDLYNNLGTLSDCIVRSGVDDQAVATRNMKVKIYLSLKTFLISVYFHIYLFYESKDVGISYFYLRKSLLTSIGDIMPHYVTLLGKSEVISDMIINPTLEMAIHKSNQINLSVIVRVNYLIFHLKKSPDHERLWRTDNAYFNYFQLLCQLSSAVTRAAEFTISAISKLSNRYYYAWRITRGQTYLLKTITLTQFYEDNYLKASQLYSIRYTYDQVKELVTICESTLSKFSKTEFCTYGFTTNMDKDLYRSKPYTSETLQSNLATDSSTVPLKSSTNSEIDKIWLQVLSLKHDMALAGNSQDAPIDFKAPITPTTKGADNRDELVTQDKDMMISDPSADLERFGYDLEMATAFDLLSEMPFEEMLDV